MSRHIERREFCELVKNAGIIGVGVAAGLIPFDIQAAQLKPLPGAVSAERSEAIRTIWDFYHNKRYLERTQKPSNELALVLMGIWGGKSYGYSSPSNEDMRLSHIYHLLLAQMGSHKKGNWTNDNLLGFNDSLNEFESGMHELYHKKNEKARFFLQEECSLPLYFKNKITKECKT